MAASLATVTSTMAAATAGFAPGQVAATLGMGGLESGMDIDEKEGAHKDQPEYRQEGQRRQSRGQERHEPEKKSLHGGHLTLADFRKVRTLGTGTFARVCLVQPAPSLDLPPQSYYALKMLRKTEVIKLKQIDHVRQERAILGDVSGFPFITNLLASFSDRDFLYLLLDYVPGGELFSYLRRYRRFDEQTAQFYAAEIVLVLEYLHEAQGGVAYRDLKPENLLIDAEGHVRLVDFGFAKRLGNNKSGSIGSITHTLSHTLSHTSSRDSASGRPRAESDADNKPCETYTLCGTPEYLAPEVIHNKGHTTAVDWWALGILIYEFLTGYPPFWHQNPIEIYKQIVEKPVIFPHEPPISHDAKDIIRSLCTVDRSRRLGNISGGAARVKAHPFFKGIDWDALYHRRQNGPIIPNVRYPGDAQCFDVYPEEDQGKDPYTDEMMREYDDCFKDFDS